MMKLDYIKNKIIESAMNGTLNINTEYDLPYIIKLNGVDKALNLYLEKFISEVYTFYKKGIDIFTEEEQKKIYFENIDKGEFDPNWYEYDEDIFLTERANKIKNIFYDMFGVEIPYFDLGEFIEMVETEVENVVKRNIQKIISKLKEIEKWVDVNGPYTKANKKCRRYSENFFSQDRVDRPDDKFEHLPDYFMEQYAGQTWWGECKFWEWYDRDREYNLKFMEFFEIVANEFDPLNNHQSISDEEISDDEDDEDDEDE
jgi:hypothetical protein